MEKENHNHNHNQPAPPPMPQGEGGLKRKLGVASAVGLIVGTMIGSGIFVTPGLVLEKSGSVWLSLTIWVACGIFSTLGAMCYIELGTVVPVSGGEYVYFKEAFGEVPAFLFAWVATAILRPAVGVVTLAFAQYSITPFIEEECVRTPECYAHYKWPFRLLSAFVLITQCFVNSVSVSLTAKIQNLFTVAKVLSIGLITVCGLYNLSQGMTSELSKGFEGSNWNFGNLATAFYGGLWAYDGWNTIGYISEELHNPYRTLPLAIFLAMPLVIGCYFFANLSYSTVMTQAEIIAGTGGGVAIVFGNRMLGALAFLMPLSVALSTYGSANGSVFAAGRLCYVASKNGHLPKVVSFTDIKRHTPSVAMTFNAILAISYTLFLDIGPLIEFFSFTAWIFYGSAAAALITLRFKKPDAPRPFKVPIIIPVTFCLFAAFLVLMPIVMTPSIGHLLAIGFMFLGLLVYYPFVYKKYTMPGMATASKWIQIIFQVVPPEIDPNSNVTDEIALEKIK